MNRDQILNSITAIFRDVLDEDLLKLNENSSADTVDGWDSLTHVELVAKVEKQFKIRFTAKEIQGWKKVGEMIDSIISKTNLHA